MQRMSSTGKPALFGKLPSRGDFLRVGPADEALHFVESWLTAAVEQSRGEQAAEPVRFLLAHAQEVLLGCWVPSQDEIGRRFPFACFERVPPDVAELGWSLLLGLHDAFLGEVEELLRRASAASSAPLLEGLQAQLGALERPHPSELVRALSDAQARLATESVASFEQRAFGALASGARAAQGQAGSPDAMPYALLTLREAVRRGTADPTLDLPAASAFDLFVWLELAGGFARGAPRFPSLCWCPQQARALVAAGPPSLLTMAFLVDPRHASNSRWPVWTDRPAGAQAMKELAPALQEALAGQVSLAELVESVRRGE
jgi:type VI secretion system ImpM family protein